MTDCHIISVPSERAGDILRCAHGWTLNRDGADAPCSAAARRLRDVAPTVRPAARRHTELGILEFETRRFVLQRIGLQAAGKSGARRTALERRREQY